MNLNIYFEFLKPYEEEVKKLYGTEQNLDLCIHHCLNNVNLSPEGLEYYRAATFFLYKKMLQEFEESTGFKPYENIEKFLIEFVFKRNDLYDKDVFNLDVYSKDDIKKISKFILPLNDRKFTYTGLKILYDRYLTKNHQGKIVELPQIMYLLISMVLASAEKPSERLQYVKKFYDMLSNFNISVATPILLNCRRPHRQLSSCFVLTIEDDLDDIFENIKQMALISKRGGGIGVYLGKLRGLGSPIGAHKNASSGIIPVVKIINDVMIYVDQLGVRKGSASITLDIWHTDVLDFLEIKTNAGDERKKAHDVHPAISIPDIFMKRLLEGKKWTLMNPYYTKKVKSDKNLEDFYGEEFEELYEKLEKELPQEAKKEIDAFELWKRIITVIFETGEPFIFFRDTANKLNPNKHCGMIYSSNLCMEIIQNMKPKKHLSYYTDETMVYDIDEAGDLVVCNLASINLYNYYHSSDEKKEEIIECAVRMLDNAITINKLPEEESRVTNQKYRAIGIGVNNYHHLLASEEIKYESQQHLEFVDKLFERIAYQIIKTSMLLAKERGSYPLFKGSDWEKGIWFGRRVEEIENNSKNPDLRWKELWKNVKENGLRNGYLIALMPTGSTSLIIGATQSFEPVFEHFYKEENMSGILPQFPPDVLLLKEYYDTAYNINQKFMIDAASIRQKWVDQSQSLNLYINPLKITGPELSELYIYAWQKGLKTVYYCRSKSITDINEDGNINIGLNCSINEDCEMCQA